MRPMTAREALEIERSRSITDSGQARRLLNALVELREADKAWAAQNCTLRGSALERLRAAGRKLTALERGEEPKED